MASKKSELNIEKSLWRGKRHYWKFFCPHCKGERRVFSRPNPVQFSYLFKLFVATAFFMMLFWNLFHWNGVVIFLPLWMGFEVYFRIRMRADLICARCGFDPVLFLRDVNLAKKEVEKFWEGKLKPYEEAQNTSKKPQSSEAPTPGDATDTTPQK